MLKYIVCIGLIIGMINADETRQGSFKGKVDSVEFNVPVSCSFGKPTVQAFSFNSDGGSGWGDRNKDGIVIDGSSWGGGRMSLIIKGKGIDKKLGIKDFIVENKIIKYSGLFKSRKGDFNMEFTVNCP